ncbi:MAG: glutamate dehydrogenase, partial [Desulfatiglandales bacterium]
TGKPVSIGGTLGRRDATGRGVVYTIVEAAKHLGLDLRRCSAVVQGFGNVGSVTARDLANLGVKIVAVSDRSGEFWNDKGLPIDDLVSYKVRNRRLEGFPEAEKISGGDLFKLKCDILIPSAGEMEITADNAGSLNCRLVAEGANGPTTIEADEILREREIFVIPDILANAGGVIVSYFEWVQDLQNFFWVEDEVNRKLRDILTRVFHEVLRMSQKDHVNMRLAALMIGIRRVSQAMLWRGLYA